MKPISPMLLSLLLCSACSAPQPPRLAVAEAQAAQASVCDRDTPTGTRFSKVSCKTAEQARKQKESVEQAKDDLRQMRSRGPDERPGS